MSAPSKPRMISEHQAVAVQVLHGKLGRPLPPIAHLTHAEAGDLIIELRDALSAAAGRQESER